MQKFVNLTQIMLSLLLLSVLACSPESVVAATPVPKKITPALSPKAAWEEDWEATLTAAKKEGEVIVYTLFGAEWRRAMTEVMTKRYGITLNALTGRTDELIERLMREQMSKVYQADIFIAVSSTSFVGRLQPAGVLQSIEKMLILPEVVDSKVWRGDKIFWFDPNTKTLFIHREYVSPPLIINTDLVMPQEMKFWDDLLNPKWKGKLIINDPTSSGAGRQIMHQVAYGIKDWDWIARLLKQQPTIQRDYRLMTEWVARGKYAILFGPRKEEAYHFIKEGAPIKFLNFQDGGVSSFGGSGSIAVPKGSPHPNAAKVFLNFFLSKEGQTITAKTGGYPSLRVDVPTDFLDPSILLQPGVKYFSDSQMDYLKKAPEISRKMAELIAPLKK